MVTVGLPFHKKALLQARAFSANMDSLVSLGTLAAWCFSLWSWTAGHRHLYFESAAVIITFITIGRWLEERAKFSTREALRSLAALQPRTAVLLAGAGTEWQEGTAGTEVLAASLKAGDVVLVPSGATVPGDGVVVQGAGTVDTSAMTGESVPEEVQPGSPLVGGHINLAGPLVVRLEKTGADTVLAGIIRVVGEAQASKAPVQQLVDRVALWFVPAVILISLFTLAGWLAGGATITGAVMAAVAVLVISCPCAMGLATPIAVVAGVGRGARMGALIRDAASLEALHKATRIVFDKTGTLTEGRPRVVRVYGEEDAAELTRRIVSLEALSTHPFAIGIRDYHGETGDGPAWEETGETAGQGMWGRYALDGRSVEMRVGRDTELTWSDADRAACDEILQADPALSPVVVGVGGQVRRVYFLKDQLRADAGEGIRRLQNQGLKVLIASGDRQEIVRSLATAIDPGLEVYGRMQPAEKAALVQKLEGAGQRVIMVGDGINDAPALAVASVGLAMGSGTRIAMETAAVTMEKVSIGKVADVIHLSRATFRVIRQNLAWAFLYNVILIPVAALGYLNPMLASAAMAMSSICVVLNGARLRWV